MGKLIAVFKLCFRKGFVSIRKKPVSDFMTCKVIVFTAFISMNVRTFKSDFWACFQTLKNVFTVFTVHVLNT